MNVDLRNADYEIESESRAWKNYGDNPDAPNMVPAFDNLPTAGFLQMNQTLVI